MNSNKIKAIFAGDFDKLAIKLSVVFALILPLCDVLVLSPLCEIILANIGEGILFEMMLSFEGLVGTAAFLCQCTLIVCAVLASRTALGAKLLLFEGLSFIFIGVFLKSAVFWLSAVIDEYILADIGVFALSNYTLATIEEGLLVWWSMISYFLNALMLTLIMTVGFVAALIKVRAVRSTGRKFSPEALAASLPKNGTVNVFVSVPAVVFLISQLAYLVMDTLETLAGEIPQLISTYVTIITPYAYLILQVALSYFVCQYVAYVMISRLNKK